jgi:GNAT superfamily N-acetyltransferase
MPITYIWRGDITNTELNTLHADAFGTRVFDDAEWNWKDLLAKHSLGWVVARDDTRLVGFVNVVWDGLVHAWIQDTMVAADARGHRIGTELVVTARHAARDAGCEWLHVDFGDHLSSFYYGACGFTPTNAGLIALQP